MAKTDNQKYVDRSLAMCYDPDWEDGLRRANCRKNGAPFQYADAMIMQAAAIRIACRMSYRHIEDIICGMLGGAIPCYTTIYRRIQNLDVDMCGRYVTVRDGAGGTVLIADATGLKQHNCGEQIRHKWKVRSRFARLHLLIDADTRVVLAVAVTDERSGDAAQLQQLLHEAVGKNRLSGARDPDRGMLAEGMPLVGSEHVEPPGAVLYADGWYTYRSNMAECARLNVTPNMRLPVNRTARGAAARLASRTLRMLLANLLVQRPMNPIRFRVMASRGR